MVTTSREKLMNTATTLREIPVNTMEVFRGNLMKVVVIFVETLQQ